MSDDKTDVVVLGAGIVGVSAAFCVSQRGMSVVLVDRREPGSETSYGNAGVLSSGSISPLNNPSLWSALPKYLGNQHAALRWNIGWAFRNPDWVPVMLHSYRSRWGEALLDRRSVRLEAKVKATRRLATPTLFLQGGADRVTAPAASEKMAATHSGPFERIVLDGMGHFLPREAPDAIAGHLVRHFGRSDNA